MHLVQNCIYFIVKDGDEIICFFSA